MKSKTITMSVDSHYINQRQAERHYLRLRGNVNKDLAGTAFGSGCYVKVTPHFKLDDETRRHYLDLELVEKDWDTDVAPDGIRKIVPTANGRFEITFTPVHYMPLKKTIKIPATFITPGLLRLWFDDQVLKTIYYKTADRTLYDVLGRRPKLPPPAPL